MDRRDFLKILPAGMIAALPLPAISTLRFTLPDDLVEDWKVNCTPENKDYYFEKIRSLYPEIPPYRKWPSMFESWGVIYRKKVLFLNLG